MVGKILDMHGNPVERARLETEEAKPTIMGVRSTISSRQTTGITPAKVARILRDADQGQLTAYLELAEELEEKDAHYLSVIGTRKRAVAQLEISVEAAGDTPEDQRNTQLVQEWLRRDYLQSEIFNMLDAIAKGFSVTELIWETAADRWLPKDLIWRDPRYFAPDPENSENLLLRTDEGTQQLEPLKYIVHRHSAKSGVLVRGGVVRPCVWMWLFKNFSVKDWVIFAEAYGQPIRLGKYGAGASQADKDILMRAVASIGSDAAAIIPESMKIEFIEAEGKTGTADVFQKLCTFCDLQISKAVIGQTTTTDAVSGGHAVSKEHNEVREDIERSDAMQLAATLNTQLIPAMIALNFGPQKRYPRLRIGRPESLDVEKLAKTAETAAKLGVQISKSKLRERLNLPAPIDKDDILVPPSSNQVESPTAATALAASEKGDEKDQIDDLVEELSSDYEEILNPLLKVVQSAMDSSRSFDEFKDKLQSVAGELTLTGLAEKLGDASFITRLAGNLEIELESK